MKRRWIRRMSSAACTLLLLAMTGQQAKAYSEEEEYITISVEAADESGTVTYALDTDDPEAFGSESEFSGPAAPISFMSKMQPVILPVRYLRERLYWS